MTPVPLPIPMHIFDVQYLYINTPHFTGIGAASRTSTYDVDGKGMSDQANNKTTRHKEKLPLALLALSTRRSALYGAARELPDPQCDPPS